MMKLTQRTQLDSSARGTALVFPDFTFRSVISTFKSVMIEAGYQEVILPAIEHASVYTGERDSKLMDSMYVFADKKGRVLCLRPEATATLRELADKFHHTHDIKLYYVTRCWRYERPQAGRYREFWQLGCEWLNPSGEHPVQETLIKFLDLLGIDYQVHTDVPRGLNYYTPGTGFEANVSVLGAQSQIAGGGSYSNGAGFAIGLERLIMAMNSQNNQTSIS